MKRIEYLEVFNRADELCYSVYIITNSFPRKEMFVLTSQIQRAAISVPNNLAEGFERGTIGDYIRSVECFMALKDR